tara:strand:+ start:231 stop:413 length:183 start_codon:yes stop_codon:yes gene_type:complete
LPGDVAEQAARAEAAIVHRFGELSRYRTDPRTGFAGDGNDLLFVYMERVDIGCILDILFF